MFKSRKKKAISADQYLSEEIYLTLVKLNEIKQSYPASLSEEEWDEVLEAMIEGFKMMSEGKHIEMPSEEEFNKMNLALEYFAKYFMDLWS